MTRVKAASTAITVKRWVLMVPTPLFGYLLVPGRRQVAWEGRLIRSQPNVLSQRAREATPRVAEGPAVAV